MRKYLLIKQASVILRSLFFERMIEKLNITNNQFYNFLISLFISYIVHAISYGVVYLFYNRGEDPGNGSFKYFLAYINFTFWTWLILECVICIQTADVLIDVLLYVAIVGIVITNYLGILLLKKIEQNS